MKADYSCKVNGCPYFVDSIDMPNTNGYSMARQGYGWFGCMYYVATINNMGRKIKPCIKEELIAAAAERQLVLL
ncbi:MAG: hypothetical protein ACRKGH_09605 [Dehalogenimonas sp.]